MKAEEIIKAVSEEIHDDSFDDTTILGYINACAGQLASVYEIPGLLYTKEIVVDANSGFSVSAPGDFLRSIFHAVNLTTKEEIEVYSEFADFVHKYPLFDEKGPITAITWFGPLFYFQGAPTKAETLRVMYYGAPKQIIKPSEPNFIPKHLHSDIFVNYCCAEAYNSIEDGVDGTKVNHNKFTSRFQLACVKLEGWIGVPTARPYYIKSESSYRDPIEDL